VTAPTAKQLEVHAFMLAYHDTESMWPTVREIAKRFGMSSTNAVMYQLRELKKKGLARQRVGCARGWIAVEQQGVAS